MSYARTLARYRPLNVAIAVALGVSSGYYVFNEPLKKMHEEDMARQAAEISAAGGAVGAAGGAPKA